ncbi:MotA/TolQ/ExbB proton channel family protein [Cystobacter fuscus DSM 2262]|uniref:MotA/TolQ/ExbB proton channel family protein n=1 Tax=Cystobacter fuscus (strain ATCC 25194 / DSM 2262 / NBRC 100088 / M29) TaxID=1242864 RepID=S9PBJ1_CYSF2|nr:MotA/TolQ/ExbB proton channel family protein [Cystobacter fuscus]EPX59612.1 MotA/TolQ/ExbB proton channel family protein [Cystobacter fuscus DSM 2262]
MSLSDILHYLRIGGFTLAFLLLASTVALVVAIERLITLWGVSERSRLLGDTVHKHLLRGDIAAARSATERSNAAVADIFLAGFDRFERTRGSCEGVDSAVERERAQVGLRLRRNLWLLATIGSLTPFVGLFGTVAGIMKSFKDLGLDVAAGGTGGTGAVMTGISEALVATAVGILVAVQAMAFYNYFQARLSRVLVELRLLGEEFVELLRERPLGAPAALAPAAPAAVAEARSPTDT